jgi:gamma-glutamyltranspeptidase/glutathione hydrolase
LHAYRAVDRQPVRFSYRGNEIVSVPPPSSGGITLGLMLGVLEQVDLAGRKAGTLDELDWLARAGAIAFADRNAYLGDQDWSPDIDMRRLLERGRVAARAEAARHATPGPAFPAGPGPEAGQSEGNHTTHLSVVDADRNVVSCTTTIEESMGSALVVAGRGFLLNNELTDFDLNKASGPNAFDPGRRPRRSALSDNKEPAGKRPRSSMTPVLVFRDGRPVLTAGSPGGSFIIGIVAQILVNVLDHDMNMQRAIDAPRLSSQNRPLNLESLYPDRNQLMEGLQGRGWKLSNDQFPGNAHGIRLRPDGKLEGGTDPRGEGTARGY